MKSLSRKNLIAFLGCYTIGATLTSWKYPGSVIVSVLGCMIVSIIIWFTVAERKS